MKRLIAIFLLLFLLAIPFAALLLNRNGGDFAGTDDLAVKEISNLNPGYSRWAEPLWEPSESTASLLFSLQAALGSGVLFYVIGYLNGRGRSGGTRPHPKG